ncbi:hypothetical protein [Candidatus Nitrospira inopinata]|nr:hypothetical protein [Candidatus Nitrospira inopinata]
MREERKIVGQSLSKEDDDMKVGATIKQTVAAFAAVAGLAVVGLPSPASALEFPFGDLAFVVYGGDTERYENMGTGSVAWLEETPRSFGTNIASVLPVLQQGAALGVRWALYGSTADGYHMYMTSQARTITPQILENIFPTQAAERFLEWGQSRLPFVSGGIGNTFANNPLLLPASNPQSFTNFVGREGQLGGYTPFQTHGPLDRVLTLLKVNTDGFDPQITIVGTAVLTRDGQLRVTPIPIPAAVILFGSGLIGLVGLSRRSMNKTA